MSTKEWESMLPFGELRREMDRLLDSFVGGIGKVRPFRSADPRLNMWEDDLSFVVEAEVPGLVMDDLDVQVVGDELVVKGRWSDKGEDDRCYHVHERHKGEFSRTLSFPKEVQADKVEASMKNGLLTVTLPKTSVARVRKINVRGEST